MADVPGGAPLPLPLLLDRALNLHRAGDAAQAEKLYRQILGRQRDHPRALHGLGLLACEAGQTAAGVDLLARAVAVQPDVAEFQNHLAQGLIELKQFDAALKHVSQALEIDPNLADAHVNAGDALRAIGSVDSAIASYQKAIALNPSHLVAHNNLGVALRDLGRIDEARAAFQKVTELDPALPQGHSNLAGTLKDISQVIAEHRKAIALKPGEAKFHNDLGTALEASGQLREAEAAYEQAIALDPNYAEAVTNLGNAYHRLGRIDDAMQAYRKAISISPDLPQAWCNLGNLLKDQGQIDPALKALKMSVQVAPRSSLKDKAAAFHSNLLLCLHYDPAYEPRKVFQEHLHWAELHAKPLSGEIGGRHGNDCDPRRRLRIGYVSADFCRHPVNFFFEPILAHHDHANFEVFCYADEIWPDAVTDRLRSQADHWRNITAITDRAAADLIRRDGIDLLIDLGGHTGYNRLLVFARKPAPVQITYLGYPDTTGMTAIDYRFTDALADPPGVTESLHTEQLVRLPRSAWCYLPPATTPAVDPPPSLQAGCITFGSFNILPKITPIVMETWSQILLAVPGSKLLMKNKGLSDASTADQVRGHFECHGIEAQRLIFRSNDASHADHLRSYSQMDIALDPFPYHGTTSTCETLWMGVPVVALAGQTHVARVGVSLLNNVGHAEWVARSPQEYIEIATSLAGDPSRLATIRSSLRDRFRASPLCDYVGFTRHLETAYRQIWERWCSSNHPSRP